VKLISTGQPSTLKTYRQIAKLLSQDENSKVIKFFDKKIKESPNGENEEVITDESQMMLLIAHMAFDNIQSKEEDDE